MKFNAEVVTDPSVYVIVDDSTNASDDRPAVADPMLKVTPAVCVSVPVYPVQFKLLQAAAPVSMVMPPDDAVSNTSSPDPGTTPPTHDPVADQLPPPAEPVIVAIFNCQETLRH